MEISINYQDDVIVSTNDFGRVSKAQISVVEKEFDRFNERILPKNCVYYTKFDAYAMYVIELAPGMYPISWNKYNFDEYGDQDGILELKSVEVAMPWQYFILVTDPNVNYVEDFRVFWRKEKLTSIDDYLTTAHLPNVGEDGVCHGYSRNNSSSYLTGNELIEDYIAVWMESPYNDDYGNIDDMLPMNRYTWAMVSKKDFFIWETFNYSGDYTIREFINDWTTDKTTVFGSIDNLVAQYGENLGIVQSLNLA